MTTIEWTGRTWNPTTGCDRVSPGCDLCYALTMARRLKAMGSGKYQTDGDPRTSGPGFGVAVHEDVLRLPYTWKKPELVFVNSMSDLFHARVPLDFIRRVFEVIEATPRHTYQVLTKRAARLPKVADRLPWPPNLWMGVSVENQEQADQRIPALLDTPAAVRWISAEPLLLGPIDLDQPRCDAHGRRYAVTDSDGREWCGYCAADGFSGELSYGHWLDPLNGGINWVVTGGESGPEARPMHPDWARSLRDQCVEAGVPFFFKQWGEYAPAGVGEETPAGVRGRLVLVAPDGRTCSPRMGALASAGSTLMARYGKTRAGRLLDGRTWDEFPVEVAQ